MSSQPSFNSGHYNELNDDGNKRESRSIDEAPKVRANTWVFRVDAQHCALKSDHPFIVVSLSYLAVLVVLTLWTVADSIIMGIYFGKIDKDFPTWEAASLWKKVILYFLVFDIVTIVTCVIQMLAFAWVALKYQKFRPEETLVFIGLLVFAFLSYVAKYVFGIIYGESVSYISDRFFNGSYGISPIFMPSYTLWETAVWCVIELGVIVTWIIIAGLLFRNLKDVNGKL